MHHGSRQEPGIVSRSTEDQLRQLQAALTAVHTVCGGELDAMVGTLIGALIRVASYSGCYDAILAIAIQGLEDAKALHRQVAAESVS